MTSCALPFVNLSAFFRRAMSRPKPATVRKDRQIPRDLVVRHRHSEVRGIACRVAARRRSQHRYRHQSGNCRPMHRHGGSSRPHRWPKRQWRCSESISRPRSLTSTSRSGCTYPVSSVALLLRIAGWPLHFQGIRKRVKQRDITGSCRCASAHDARPSAETSTLATRPRPLQARPRIS